MFTHEHREGDRVVRVELSTREIKRWRDRDYTVLQEAERDALIAGLRSGVPEYFIGGVNRWPKVDQGFIEDLQKRYPDVTKDSV